MGNGIVSFTVDRQVPGRDAKGKIIADKFDVIPVTYTLHFGMRSVEVMAQRMITSAPDSSIKWLTDIVYSGLVNENYLNGEPEISYREAALIVEALLETGTEIQNEIIGVYSESKASKKLNDILDSLIPKEEKKSAKSSSRPIGRKLKYTPSPTD